MILSRESGAPFPKRSSRAAYFSRVIWGVQFKFNEPSELNVYFIYVYLGFKKILAVPVSTFRNLRRFLKIYSHPTRPAPPKIGVEAGIFTQHERPTSPNRREEGPGRGRTRHEKRDDYRVDRTVTFWAVVLLFPFFVPYSTHACRHSGRS